MSYRRNRKRRHSQAFIEQDEQEQEITQISPVSGDLQEQDGEESELTRKETEIWDAFREEHYEAIEQLPLSLHRQYILLRELDEQAQEHNKDVLPTIKRYVELRRSMVSRPAEVRAETRPAAPDSEAGSAPSENDLPAKSEPPPTPVQNLSMPLNGDRFSAALSAGHSGSPTKNQGTPAPMPLPVMRLASSTVRTPTPMSIPPNRMKMPQTTREMLSHIAWLSEEILRASDEKVNLAQAAYDSVDRHIRLLDQSIKEQEASIALGMRPGTHLAPILLPEVIVPGSRVPRQVQESAPEEQDGGMTLGMVGGEGADDMVQPQRRGRANKKGRSKRDVAPTTAAGGSRGRTLKLNGPAPEISVVAVDEERYCYCNQVSFGEMVACDNDNCQREWFHLGCVGLDKPPGDDESWYCRDCQHLAKATKTLRNRRRKR